MRRASISAGALVCAACALAPAVARAQDRTTKLGWQLFGGGGARLGAASRSVNLELERGGWSALPVAAGEGHVGFGLTVWDFTVDLHFQGGEYALAGPGGREDALSVYGSAIGVELGYRAHVGRFVTLNPFVGIGSTDTSMCFSGVPSDASDASRSAFQQVLLNPARGTCLDASDVALDLGLTALASVPFPFGPAGASERLVGWLGVGPRFAFTLPLTFTRTWEAIGYGDTPIALPPFEGPVAPLGGAYVGVEVVFRGGIENIR